MKTMKQVLLIALLITGSQIFAQGKGGDPAERMRMGDRMRKQWVDSLGLSEGQKAALKAFRVKARQEDSLQIASFRQERRRIQETRKNELKSILTEEQWKKWEQMKPMRGQKAMEGMSAFSPNRKAMQQGNRLPVPRKPQQSLSVRQRALQQTDRLYKSLNLSDEQAVKVLAIHEKYARKDSVLRNNKQVGQPLTEEARQAIRQEKQNERMSMMKEITQVLKPYQKIKYNELIAFRQDQVKAKRLAHTQPTGKFQQRDPRFRQQVPYRRQSIPVPDESL